MKLLKYFVVFSLFISNFAKAETKIYTPERSFRLVLPELSERKLILIYETGDVAALIEAKTGNILRKYTGSCSGTAFSYPFVVGVAHSCFLNNETGTIEELEATPSVENAFAVTYLDQDDGYVSFLMNSKPWESDGFIHMRTVNKRNNSVTQRQIAHDVPLFSGAMFASRQDNTLYYAAGTGEWSNILYTASHENLQAALKTGNSQKFANLFQEHSRFPGLSMNVDMEGSLALYHGYEPYFYDVSAKTTYPLRLKDCSPFAILEEHIYATCTDNALYGFSFAEAIEK